MDNYDYLRKQGLSDVWRVPTLDRQFVIEPRRITRDYGRVRNVAVMWETLGLPDATSRWHVYDAGPVSSVSLNLFRRCHGWTPLSEATNKRGVYINAYVGSGVELPRFDSFYRYTETGSLVFAFKINKKFIPNLDTEAVFIRVYSGASIHQNYLLPNLSTSIKTNGLYVVNAGSIDALALEIAALPNTGRVNIYHNGVWYDALEKISIEVGDWIEYIFDSSVYKTFEFAVSDLVHYNSTVDSDQKYILHYSGESTDLDFQDDIDVYVFQKDNGEPLRGVYYHKNSSTALRQLTHRDYGLRTRNFAPIARILEGLKEPIKNAPVDSLFVRLDIRRSAITPSSLVFEHSRIFEMYKMDDEGIMRCLQGIDATVPFWRAEELEKSVYCLGMRIPYNAFSKELAEDIYGYNAAAKIIGDTPVKYNKLVLEEFPLPIRMQHGSTMYEYDSEGLLLEWSQHLGGAVYKPKNPLTAYVEGIVGLGGNRLSEVHNARTLALEESFTYRVYRGSLVGNAVQKDFEDVTGTALYEVVNKNFNWLSPRTVDYPVVMSDERFFARDYKVRSQFGNINITLSTQQNRPTGDGFYAMPVPMGQMDVFLNRHSLIQGLDYFVKFPEVIIVNKEYLVDAMTEEQEIHIRYCGFPTGDLQNHPDGDVGFIEHGYLSNNNRFDVRDDKVQRVVIGGKLYTKDELEFSEEHSGIAVTSAANGLPYMVKDLLVPVKPFTHKDMYSLIKKSREVDKVVSDYLSVKLPQPDRGVVMAIPQRYQVFSPFMNKLITDIRSGLVRPPTRLSGFSKQEVIDICKIYEGLLEFDPLKNPEVYDKRFVVIHPHGYPQVINVSANAYRFLTKVVEVYCKGLITLSPFIKTA